LYDPRVFAQKKVYCLFPNCLLIFLSFRIISERDTRQI
jgi:hypothetical protein